MPGTNLLRVENAVHVTGFWDPGLFPFNKEVVLKTNKIQMSQLFVSTSDTMSSVQTCVTSTVTSPDQGAQSQDEREESDDTPKSNVAHMEASIHIHCVLITQG